MRKRKEGVIGLQALLVTATIGIASLIAVPEYRAMSEMAAVAEAMTLAEDLQRQLDHRLAVTGRFPTTNRHASAMVPTRIAHPDLVRYVQIQPDRDGDTAVIKVFLRDGAVVNPTGEPPHIFITGIKSDGDQAPVEWHCGAAGLRPELLPDDCRG